jgi:hypothetical protein
VANVDAESAFDPMADSIEDITNVSAADVRPGMERARHAPAGDELAQGGDWYPVQRRMPVMVPPDERPETVYAGSHGSVSREASRGGGPMDLSAWLTGADDGLTPEVRGDVLARRQAPAQVRVIRDGE